MSYRHYIKKTPRKTLSMSRTGRTAHKFDKMREHEKRDMYNMKYSQLNSELETVMKNTEVRPPAFSDISTILLRSKKYASRNEYNKAIQQLTLAITAMLALCSPAESQFNSAKGGLGPELGICSDPEVLLKWHMIPSITKPKPPSRKTKKTLKTRNMNSRKASSNTKVEGKKKFTQKRRK